ncbi:ABC transporter [Ahrensia sp. R2A130]|nr:ABC transporter [Ahrensia sp. R2A130]
MKKIFIASLACLALFGLTACEGIGKGKGKAPVTVSG